MQTSDGAGVNLRRAVGSYNLPDIDPFLLLDEMHSDNKDDYIAGFPPHPHRGFETVSYMLEGKMAHKDSTGSKGLLETGGVQWMSAGSGVIHSEMPKMSDGLLWGFQIWVNVKSEDKMKDPVYREFKPDEIPEKKIGSSGVARIIAGNYAGVEGAVKNINTKPLLVDVRLEDRSQFSAKVVKNQVSLIYVYKGEAEVSGQKIKEKNMAILTEGDEIEVSGENAGFLVLSGTPTNEPIARHGPFVMNTREEIEQAFEDLRTGDFIKSA